MAKWTGWWEQRVLGRQNMHNLLLDVAVDGTVTGEGDDCVGPFTFRGQLRSDGTLSLVKQYLGRHRVIYEGCNSGEGVFGIWHIPGFWSAYNTGKFALTPTAEGSTTCDQIQELVPTCQASRR